MNELELRKRNLATINKVTKMSKFLIARVVRADPEVFGKAELTVDNSEFSKLVEYMILNKLKEQGEERLVNYEKELL